MDGRAKGDFIVTVQSTTQQPPTPRRPRSGYQYKKLEPADAKTTMRLPFVPETAYRVMLGELDLGIVVYHVVRGVVRDWFAEGCLSTQGLRRSFGTREYAAKGLRLRAQREGRI